jgi:hypothetical protein
MHKSQYNVLSSIEDKYKKEENVRQKENGVRNESEGKRIIFCMQIGLAILEKKALQKRPRWQHRVFINFFWYLFCLSTR